MENEKNIPDGKSEIQNDVAQKKQKEEKKLPAAKLPKIFRKTYTEKSFEAKLLKKIYIDEDRELVKSIFTEHITTDKKGRTLKTPLVSVPKTAEFPKSDIKKLKFIAKFVKKNKQRVKLIPLLAVAGFIAAIVLVIFAFKNPLAKRGIKYACESAFGAKTDIGYVNVRLLKLGVTIGNLAVGNKNSAEYDYKKNLFELEKLAVSFNLTQALRGKLIAENLEVSGIQFGTDRTTSCYLPVKEKPVEKEEGESEFMKELESRSASAISDLRQQANDMLGGSNVNEIVENLMKQLKTPALASEAQALALGLTDKWKGKPDEFKAEIEKFSAEFQKYQNIDLSQFQGHPEKIAAAVAEISKTVNSVNELKASIENTVSSVKADVESAQNFAATVTQAAKDDHALVTSKLNTVASAVTNAKSLFNNALETVAYNLLGKYYPYAKKALNYAAQMKERTAAKNTDGEKAKSAQKGKTGRLCGTTIPFSKNYPTLWIKNVSASGYTDKASGKGFTGTIKNVTSDQDMAGRPTSAQAKFDFAGTNHDAAIVLDARTVTKEPLVTMNYSGKGFSANIDGTSIAREHGVPSVSGGVTLSLKGTAGTDGFSAAGTVGLSNLSLTSDGFPNKLVTKYYNDALSAVKSMNLGYEVSFYEQKGLNMSLLGDFADVFANMLKSAILSFASDAKDKALAEMNKYIDSHLGEGLGGLKQLLSISGDFDIQNMNADSLKKMMQDKITEIQNAGTAVANEAAAQAMNEALKNIPGASSSSSSSAKIPLNLPDLSSGKSNDSSGSESAGGKSETEEKSNLTDDGTEKNDKAKEAISKGLKSLFKK